MGRADAENSVAPKPLQKQLSLAEKQVPYDVAIEIARIEDEANQKTLVKEAVGGATVRQIREKTKALKKNSRMQKKPEYVTQKIRVTRRWVIVHHESPFVSKEDYIGALSVALKTVKGMDL